MKRLFFRIFPLLLMISIALPVQARELRLFETPELDIEVRIFPAQGDILLLGFPCDEGKSIAEEKTAQSLANDGIEVWMPDLLSAYMLPKVKSSLQEIEPEVLVTLIDAAMKTGKQVYLVASGADTLLILRAAQRWEQQKNNQALQGAILLFPRLFKGEPQPGMKPEYHEVVGSTRLPIMLMEGERTPNRWGLMDLSNALQQEGSPVISKIIPMVRGYFFKRADANRSEDVVTSQLAGLIKVSLFFLNQESSHD